MFSAAVLRRSLTSLSGRSDMVTILGACVLALPVIAAAAVLYASYTLMDTTGNVAMNNDQTDVGMAERALCTLRFELQTATELHLDVTELAQRVSQAEIELTSAQQRAEQRAANPGIVRVGQPAIKIRPVPMPVPASFHSKD